MEQSGWERKTISRSDVRQSTIRLLARTKADPSAARLTPGQRRYITRTVVASQNRIERRSVGDLRSITRHVWLTVLAVGGWLRGVR